MKRRQFLGLAATSASALVCQSKSASAPASNLAQFAQPRLLQMLRDPALIRHLGRRYRELHPAEDSQGLLAGAIGAVAPESIFAERELQVDTAVQRDFAAGRTVMLDGWVLAVTEARQCALYSLQA